MTTARQGDLFAASRGAADAAISETPDPATVRGRLHALLALVRTSSQMPWEPARARAQEYLFANMAAWLPAPERDDLRQAFASEMVRLREASPD